MWTIENWFSKYGESHQNIMNKKIHYICVPLILYSILGLLDLVLVYANISLAWGLILIVAPFYLYLSLVLGFLTIFVSGLMCLTFELFPSSNLQFYFCLFIFIISWIMQFIGHTIEGKKPSFLEDILFLLIGPLWVMRHFLAILGLSIQS